MEDEKKEICFKYRTNYQVLEILPDPLRSVLRGLKSDSFGFPCFDQNKPRKTSRGRLIYVTAFFFPHSSSLHSYP